MPQTPHPIHAYGPRASRKKAMSSCSCAGECDAFTVRPNNREPVCHMLSGRQASSSCFTHLALESRVGLASALSWEASVYLYTQHTLALRLAYAAHNNSRTHTSQSDSHAHLTMEEQLLAISACTFTSAHNPVPAQVSETRCTRCDRDAPAVPPTSIIQHLLERNSVRQLGIPSNRSH